MVFEIVAVNICIALIVVFVVAGETAHVVRFGRAAAHTTPFHVVPAIQLAVTVTDARSRVAGGGERAISCV